MAVCTCTLRLLRRCVTSLLLAMFCLPVAVIIFDTWPPRVHHEFQVQSEGKNTTWYNERVLEARMAWRRRTLKEACSRYGLDVAGNDSLHRPNAWEFLINNKYHLIWCNVFKAASSSWMFNFNLLAGYTREYLRRSNVVPLQLARKKYRRPSVEELYDALNGSLAFLIVRHPLERLLSAYRDKIQFALPNTHHAKLGYRIVQQFRSKVDKNGRPVQVRNNPRWPRFSEFVDYLILEYQKRTSLDMHWTPITEFCSPCQVDFDMILKFDTLDEDQRYLIDHAGISHLVRAEWRNPSKGLNTQELTNQFYSQLTLNQLLQLYNIYRFDFELFGYSLDKYLELVIMDSPSKANLV